MDKGKHYDTLHALHLRNADSKVYALIENITELLQQKSYTNEWDISDKISKQLGDAESERVLELVCLKLNIDYVELIHNCQNLFDAEDGKGGEDNKFKVTPRLVLHILLFSLPFVCHKLQVDPGTVQQMVEQLRASFTIDSPLSWLQAFLKITTQERNYQEKRKDTLMRFGYAVQQASDTAEERRAKERSSLHNRFFNLLRRWF